MADWTDRTRGLLRWAGSLAGACAVLLASTGTGPRAADIGGAPSAASPEFAALLADPANVELNLAYARAAEARGEWRKALATYERILVNHPGNAEALAGLAAMRRRIAPDFTNWTLEAGGGYNSNPLQRPDSADPPDSGLGFAELRLRDERRIGDWRWRTQAATGGVVLENAADALNTFYVGANVGPVLPLTPRIDVRPSVQAAYRALQAGTLFTEIGGAVELEGPFAGALQSVRLGAVYRDYGNAFVSDSGLVLDLAGHFAKGGLLLERDTFVLRPRLRYSDVDNAASVPFVPAAFAPGKYFEVGARADYEVALGDAVIVGGNFTVFQRWFADPVVPGGDDREDTFLAPGAALTLTNLVSDSVDIRFDYVHQWQTSNDPLRDFDADVATARLVVRF